MSEEPGVGHNSVNGETKKELQAFVERIERLEEEKKGISDDIGDVYKEAKGCGFDVKALRAVIKISRKPKAKLIAEKAMLDTYLLALGMEYLL